DALAVTAGFNAATSFNAFFGLTSTQSGFANSLTMEDAINLGGGGGKKLARHSVAALLNIAAGLNYNYPAGISSAAELREAVRQAYITKTFEPLATSLDVANNAGCTI